MPRKFHNWISFIKESYWKHIRIRKKVGRVAQGNFTSTPSRNGTWISRFIPLLSSSRGFEEFICQWAKKLGLTPGYSFNPCPRFFLASLQPLVFPLGPTHESVIKLSEYRWIASIYSTVRSNWSNPVRWDWNTLLALRWINVSTGGFSNSEWFDVSISQP